MDEINNSSKKILVSSTGNWATSCSIFIAKSLVAHYIALGEKKDATRCMNCLLIDDDLDDQEIFTLALNNVRPSVFCRLAKDGRAGLDIIEASGINFYDIIFIDVNMPRLNGIETLELVRKITFSKNPYLIMYSTTSNGDLISEVLAKGANEFLVKPASVAMLQKNLDSIFNKIETLT